MVAGGCYLCLWLYRRSSFQVEMMPTQHAEESHSYWMTGLLYQEVCFEDATAIPICRDHKIMKRQIDRMSGSMGWSDCTIRFQQDIDESERIVYYGGCLIDDSSLVGHNYVSWDAENYQNV